MEDDKAAEEELTDGEDNEYKHQFYGIMMVLFGAVMQAINCVANRNLKGTPPPVILFYHSINGFFIIWIYVGIEAGITNTLRLTQYTYS